MAEVLITLGIIGIVAALIMPFVIDKFQEKRNIAMYKKIFSELSQISQKLDFEYDGTYVNECNTFDNKCFMDLFAKNLEVLETCNSYAPNKCQDKSKYLDGTTFAYSIDVNCILPSLVTKKGYSIKFRFHQKGCNSFMSGSQFVETCGWMQVDVNGLKKPNVVGKDIFFIELLENKLHPGRYRINKTLNRAELYDDCKNGTGQGCSLLYIIE